MIATWVSIIAGGCATAVAFAPVSFNAFGPVKAAVLLSAVAVAAWLHAAGPSRDQAVPAAPERLRKACRTPLMISLFALLALALLSSAVAENARIALVGLYPEYVGVITLAAAFLLMLAVITSLTGDMTSLIARAAVVAALVVGTYALLQRLGLDPVAYRETLILTRARSTLGNASNLGAWLVACTPLLVLVARRDTSRPWRVAGITATVIAIASIAFTSSRGAWAAGLAALAVERVLAYRSAEKPRRRGVVASGAGFAAAATAMVLALEPRAAGRLAEAAGFSAGTVGWRVGVWEYALRLIAERPFLGWGISAFAERFAAGAPASLADTGAGPTLTASAHNVFLDAGVSAGPLAVVAVAAAVYFAGRLAWRDQDDDVVRAVSAGLVGMLVALQFHFVTLDLISLGAVLLGVLIARTEISDTPVEAQVAAQPSSVMRSASVAVAMLMTLAAFAAVGLFAADLSLGRAARLSAAGKPWSAVRPPVERACALAPWEPFMQRATGSLAAAALGGPDGETALADGRSAYRTLAASGNDTAIVRVEQGDFELKRALGVRDAEAAERAADSYAAATVKSPSFGVAWLGLGATRLAQDDPEAAVEPLERAARLMPRSVDAWGNLAQAYRAVGRSADAARAESEATRLRAEEPAR